MSISPSILKEQLGHILSSTEFPSLGQKYEGKVRDCYIADGKRTIIVTDRLSAFDRVIGTLPFKGQVLNQMAQYCFDVSKHVAPNHCIATPDPNVMVAKECRPLGAEFVMRAYLTGSTSTSIWRAYESGARTFCGHALPDGMKRHEALAKPLLTPTTKAPKGDHDESMSASELIAAGHVSAEEFERAADMAERLFAFGQEQAKARGLILVDTKYEIGVTPDGEMVVIDEIHTPDSSRYWYMDDYEERMKKGEDPRSLDKEYVRRWLTTECGYKGEGPVPELPDEVRIEAASRYIGTYELITGKAFVPDCHPNPHERIANNLGVSA